MKSRPDQSYASSLAISVLTEHITSEVTCLGLKPWFTMWQ